MIGYLIFAFIADLGALLTPCVFPMIPITVIYPDECHSLE